MTIQPARHGCHACGLLRAGFLAFQPVVDNTRVEQVVSSFQKILRGSQLTWYLMSRSVTHGEVESSTYQIYDAVPKYRLKKNNSAGDYDYSNLHKTNHFQLVTF